MHNRQLSLRVALLSSGGRQRRALSREEEQVQQFGGELFEALMVGDIRSRYDLIQERASRQGKGIRIRLRIQPPELAMLPWEFLYDKRSGEYVCLSFNTPVVRYLETAQPIQPLSVAAPLRILGLVCSPKDLEPLDVALEKQRVETALRDLLADGLVELTWLDGQTWRHLQRAMRRGPWHIFHFIGHGGFDPNRQEGLITLADDDGNSFRLYANELSRLLADHRSLRLTLLNACEGAHGSASDLFSSTAAALVRRGVPAVLAMQYKITDAAAIEFARTFYESIAESMPVDAATSEARKAISIGVANSHEWGVPVLMMRSLDGRLFEVDKSGKVEEGQGVDDGNRREELVNKPDLSIPYFPPQQKPTINRIRAVYAVGVVMLLIAGWLGWTYSRSEGGQTPTPSPSVAMALATTTPLAVLNPITLTLTVPATTFMATSLPTQEATATSKPTHTATNTLEVTPSFTTLPTATRTAKPTSTVTQKQMVTFTPSATAITTFESPSTATQHATATDTPKPIVTSTDVSKPAVAQQVTVHNQPGVDVLFLIDQSGSMGGSRTASVDHSAINDKLDLRLESPESFVQLMAEDIVQLHPNALHRVALIDFGSDARVRANWTTIGPSDWEAAQSQIKTLTERDLISDDLLNSRDYLTPGYYQTHNLGITNFAAAFQQAVTLFAQLPESETQRVRVLILLTDGYPCPQTSADKKQCLNSVANMNEVQAYTAQYFSGTQYKLYVLAMTDANLEYWSTWGPKWQEIVGAANARRVTSNTEVGRFFHEIWKELRPFIEGNTGNKIIDLPIDPGPVVVPPYLDSITFTLFKSSEDETLEVRDAQNQILSPASTDVITTGQNIYRIKIFRPQPGLWRVTTTGGSLKNDVDITMEQVIARGQRIKWNSGGVQLLPTTLTWQLIDSRGEPMLEYSDPQYLLQASVSVRVGAQPTQTVALRYQGASTYAATFTPEQAGDYSINMVAVSHDIEGQEFEVFRGVVANLKVEPIQVVQVEAPAAYVQFTPAQLTFEVRASNSTPVVVDDSVTLVAKLQAEGQTFSLSLPALGNGRFQAEWIPLVFGAHQVTINVSTPDGSGGRRTVADIPLQTFTVLPVMLRAAPGADPAIQHLFQFTQHKFVYQFQDETGKRVAVPEGTTVEIKVRSGTGEHTVAARRTVDDVFEFDYLPTASGKHEIIAVVTLPQADGGSYVAPATSLASFDVAPAFLQAVDLPAALPIFTAQHFVYEYRTSAATVLTVSESVEISAVVQAGENSWVLPIHRESAGHFVGDFVPIQTGQHQVVASVTVRSADGQVLPLGSEPIASFQVQTPRIALQPPADGQMQQYQTNSIGYEVLDQRGQPFTLAPGYQLLFTVTLTVDGAKLPDLTLQKSSDTQYEAAFTPQEAKDHQLLATANFIGPDGKPRLALPLDPIMLKIIPTTLVGIKLLQPASGATLTQAVDRLALPTLSRNPLEWFSEKQPVLIQVQLVDDQANPLDANQVFQALATAPVQLRLIDDKGQDFSRSANFQIGGSPGIYQTLLTDLPTGHYQVTLEMIATLFHPNYVLNSSQRVDHSALQLEWNWWVIGLRSGLVVILLVLVVSISARGWRQHSLRVHPIRSGSVIEIADETGRPLATRTIGGINYVRIDNLPAITRIRQLEIHCRNEADSQAGVVDVNGVLDNRTPFQARLQPDGTRQQVMGSRLYIRKIS